MAVSAGAAGWDRAGPSPSAAIRARRGSSGRRPCEREWGRPAGEPWGRDGRGGAGGALRGSGCRDRPRPARWRRCSRRGRGAGVRPRRGAGRGVRLREPFCGPLASRPGAAGASGGLCPGQPRLPPVWSLRSKTKVRRRTPCGSCGSANSASTSASGRAGIGSPAPPKCWSSSRGRPPSSPKVRGCEGALVVFPVVFLPSCWWGQRQRGSREGAPWQSRCWESCCRIGGLKYSGTGARLCHFSSVSEHCAASVLSNSLEFIWA